MTNLEVAQAKLIAGLVMTLHGIKSTADAYAYDKHIDAKTRFEHISEAAAKILLEAEGQHEPRPAN